MYSTHLVIQVQVPHLGCPVLKKQNSKDKEERKKPPQVFLFHCTQLKLKLIMLMG